MSLRCQLQCPFPPFEAPLHGWAAEIWQLQAAPSAGSCVIPKERQSLTARTARTPTLRVMQRAQEAADGPRH